MHSLINSERPKLKNRLTVPDAAKRLSTALGREVIQADVFELAIDLELPLSLHFLRGAVARRCITTQVDQAFLDDVKLNHFGNNAQLLKARILDFPDENDEFGEIVSLAQETEELFDVYDLAITGLGLLIVENEYQKLKGGPWVNYEGVSGIYLKEGNEFLYQLQEYHELGDGVDILEKLSPARSMPKGCIFVVRTAELERYVRLKNCECLAKVPISVSQLDAPVVQQKETPSERNRRRYQMCIDAGLSMADNDYANLPDGIRNLAAIEQISRQAFGKSVKAHIATSMR